MNLLAFLADKKLIQRGDIPRIEAEMSSAGETLETVLLRHNVTLEEFLKAKGELLQVPIRLLPKDHDIPFEVLKNIPEESARFYKFVPIAIQDGVLEVGVTESDNIEALDALNFISSKVNVPYKIFLISEADFTRVLDMYKNISGEVTEALEEFGSQTVENNKISKKPKGVQKDKAGVEGEGVIKEEAPVTKIVATILRYAVEGLASDIHIEPVNEKVRVRFRVDGVLNTTLILPINVQSAVIARVKILSSLKLDERRKPQDGRFSATIEGRKIDFRVSTFPTYYGEKAVLRILDPEKGVRKIDEMGFSKENIKRIHQALQKPYGLILISGPTGSGKSTTLYAMLREVDRDRKNVLSLEDPVEYNIEGVSQSQVFPEIGYTFASGLRSTLRQDPDIIMVGEIRDKETAQLAIQAALTGHLVFSTIHTNNAAGVIPRLIDMGIDPYLIAPTLILAIAQRLVRTLCPDSGDPVPVKDSVKVMIDKQFEDLPTKFKKNLPPLETLYKTKMTASCPNGTRGRTAVLEILEMNEVIERTLLQNPVEEEVYKAARAEGMLTMKEDAIIKSAERIVPFEEVNALGGVLLSDDDTSQEEVTLNVEEEEVAKQSEHGETL